jgi:predicted metal-binding protein
MSRDHSPEMVATKWSVPVMVCGECRKRTGPDNHPSALRHWLRKELGQRGLKRKVRVVESSCLDVCPKGGVAVAIAADPVLVVRDPSQWPAVSDLIEARAG